MIFQPNIRSLVNGLFLQPWHRPATDPHVSVTITASTSSLMRLTRFPVDSIPSTYGKRERERERERQEDEEEEEEKKSYSIKKEEEKRAAEGGEALWAEQKLTGPLGRPDQSLRPLSALTTGAPHACYCKNRGHQGTPRARLHKFGAEFTMQDGQKLTVREPGKKVHCNYVLFWKTPLQESWRKTTSLGWT